MADVNVTFAADDSEFRAGIDRMKRMERELQQSGLHGAAPGAAVQPPPGTVSSGGSIYRKLTDEEREAAKASNELAEAQDKVGQSSQRAGTNFSAMLERMAMRLVVFGLIFEALNKLKQAFAESIQSEALDARFSTLTSHAATANIQLEALASTAKTLGVSKADVEGLDLSLQQAGESAESAAEETDTLARYAKAAGENAKPLGEAFERLKFSQGTMADMEHFVGLMGEAGNAMREQLTSLRQEEALFSRNEEHIRHAAEMQERALDAQQRHNEAVDEFGDKLGLQQEMFQRISTGQAGTGMHVERAGVDVTEQAHAIQEREEAGEKQIEQEENLSMHQLRRLEAAGIFNEKDLMAAAQRATEAQRLVQHQKEEDDAYTRKMEKEGKELALQKEIFTAVKDRLGLDNEIAKEQDTLQGKLDRIGAQFKSIADHSEAIKVAMGLMVTAADNLAHNLGVVSGWLDKILAGMRSMGIIPKAQIGPVSQGPETFNEWMFGTSGERGRVLDERSIHQQNNEVLQDLRMLFRRAFMPEP